MEKKHLILWFVTVYLVSSFIFISCDDQEGEPDKKDDTELIDPVISTPIINYINPTLGTSGTEVNISVSDFDSKTTTATVIFGSKEAQTTFISDNTITAIAPEGYTGITVDVMVQVDTLTSNTIAFSYLLPPTITNTSSDCFYNSRFTLNGDNFGANINDNIVKFGNLEATVIKASTTSITVITPNIGADVTSVEVTVTTNSMISEPKIIPVDQELNKIATYDWTSSTIRPGIIYKTGTTALFAGSTRSVFILDITLNESNTLGIGFTTTNQTTVDLCKNYDAIAGVNAGYFPMSGATDKDPYIRIDGETVQNGHASVSQIYTNSVLIIHKNVASIRKFTQSGTNFNSVAAAIPATIAQNMIVCGPMLITKGIVENLDMSKSHNSSYTARTGLGVSEDGKRVVLVVVDSGGAVTGVTTEQLAKILLAFGTYNAMNFDGGGSSTMFVKGKGTNDLVNLPYGSSTQRKVRSVIYVK